MILIKINSCLKIIPNFNSMFPSKYTYVHLTHFDIAKSNIATFSHFKELMRIRTFFQNSFLGFEVHFQMGTTFSSLLEKINNLTNAALVINKITGFPNHILGPNLNAIINIFILVLTKGFFGQPRESGLIKLNSLSKSFGGQVQFFQLDGKIFNAKLTFEFVTMISFVKN